MITFEKTIIMINCCLVYTIPSPALPVSENYVTEKILSGGGTLKRWGWADCAVDALKFEDIALLSQETVLVYVYFGDAALTPFHSTDELEHIAKVQMTTIDECGFAAAAIHHFDISVITLK